MHKMLTAYKLNNSDTVVTQKSAIRNNKDTDFTEVRLIIPISNIKEWAKEIELMGLDEDDN